MVNEEMLNLRSFYIRLCKKIWIIPVAAVVGALISFIIYFLATTVFGTGTTYESEATLYIDFAYDEETGTQVDYYNAYTWNTLIATDEIIDTTMNNLTEMGIGELEGSATTGGSIDAGVTRAQVIADTNADIPSDVRVMVLTITDADSNLAYAIAQATSDSLVKYGESNDAFESIKVLSCNESIASVYTDRTLVAVIFGAVLGIITCILLMMLMSLLNDAAYVPEDIEKKYHLPVIGVLSSEGTQELQYFRNLLIATANHLIAHTSDVKVVSPLDKGEDKKYALAANTRLKEVLGNDFDFGKTSIISSQMPSAGQDAVKELDLSDGVIIAIPAGKKNLGAITENLLSELHKLDVPVLGFVLTDADMKFLKRYYGI
jgi:capsular polysaccharide biosynthesis protein